MASRDWRQMAQDRTTSNSCARALLHPDSIESYTFKAQAVGVDYFIVKFLRNFLWLIEFSLECLHRRQKIKGSGECGVMGSCFQVSVCVSESD